MGHTYEEELESIIKNKKMMEIYKYISELKIYAIKGGNNKEKILDLLRMLEERIDSINK